MAVIKNVVIKRVHSILFPIGSDETKKKMYSTILVVGGGMNFEGAQPWLQYRIWMGMAHQYRLMLETMDVITRPKVPVYLSVTQVSLCRITPRYVNQFCVLVFR